MAVQLRPNSTGPGSATESMPQTRPCSSRTRTTAPPARRMGTASGTRRLSPRARKAIVAAHVLVGVGWFGIVVAKIVLEIAALTTREQSVRLAAYQFMLSFDLALFPPAAIATLITGIVLSVGTAWGLFRHWWIVVKLVLTLAVVVTGIAFVGGWTEAAIDAASQRGAFTSSGADATSLKLIGMAVLHLLMLGAATVISVFKPWGRIRPNRQQAGHGTARNAAAR